MHRTLTLLATLAIPATFHAQTASVAPLLLASADLSSAVSPSVTLPDAPSADASSSSADEFDAQAGAAPSPKNPNSTVASKYSGVILPGQVSQPLTAGNKVVYGLVDSFSLFSGIGVVASAGYSHLVDSAPHYGTNSEAFGKRVGVAALRNTVQTFTTDAVFAPIFRDDPRYYALGDQHRFVNRVVYAATRVLITRTDSGRHTINAPLLLGYGVAAGLNNLYYPDRDTGAKSTFTSYAGSLGGAIIGLEVNEFVDDALRLVHIRK